MPAPLLLLLALASAAADPSRFALAERYLAQGQWRLATVEYRTLAEQWPEDPRVQLGLARAQAGVGRCEEALQLLARLRAGPGWGAEGAHTEAMCHLRRGRLTDAVVAFEEALSLQEAPEALLNLALVLSALGDTEAFEAVLQRLPDAPQGAVLEAVVRAQVALEQGHPDFEWLLAELGRIVGRQGAHVRILDARRWLDLDDPEAAAAALAESTRGDLAHLQLALWRSEAARRRGLLAAARAALGRRAIARNLDGPLAIAIQARLLVDEGRLEEAAALLQRHPDPQEPEALASAWYLARAQQDVDLADELAEAWRRGVHAADRALQQLIPIPSREDP